MRLSSIRLVNEAIYGQNLTATVFHRTKDIDSIKGMLSTGFRPGGGKMYGLGLYTTFDIESQLSPNMSSTYGPYIVKFIVKDLDQYLVFDPDEAKKVHGDGWQLNDQLKKFGISSSRDYDMYRNPFSSDLVLRLYKDVGGEQEVMSKVKGVIFKGSRDSSVLAKFEPVDDGTITMSAYVLSPITSTLDVPSPDELKWQKVSAKASIKSIYGLKPGEKRSGLAELNGIEGKTLIDLIRSNAPLDKEQIDAVLSHKTLKRVWFNSLADSLKPNAAPQSFNFLDSLRHILRIHGLEDDMLKVYASRPELQNYESFNKLIAICDPHSFAKNADDELITNSSDYILQMSSIPVIPTHGWHASKAWLLALYKANFAVHRDLIIGLVKKYVDVQKESGGLSDSDALVSAVGLVFGEARLALIDLIPTDKLAILINGLSASSAINELPLAKIINRLGGDLNAILLDVVQYREVNYAIRYLVKLGANNLQEAFNAAKWKKSKNQLAKLMQRQM